MIVPEDHTRLVLVDNGGNQQLLSLSELFNLLIVLYRQPSDDDLACIYPGSTRVTQLYQKWKRYSKMNASTGPLMVSGKCPL